MKPFVVASIITAILIGLYKVESVNMEEASLDRSSSRKVEVAVDRNRLVHIFPGIEELLDSVGTRPGKFHTFSQTNDSQKGKGASTEMAQPVKGRNNSHSNSNIPTSTTKGPMRTFNSTYRPSASITSPRNVRPKLPPLQRNLVHTRSRLPDHF